MSNPNNCETCSHQQFPDGGHCYMFRDEPTEVCMQHTGRRLTPLGVSICEGIADLVRRERDKQ